MEVKMRDREIDLLKLLVKVIDFVWSNLFLTIFLPVAGALVGWGFSHILENRSESEMMLVTQHLTEPQCEFLLAQLEKTDSFPELTEDQRGGLIKLQHKVISEPRSYSFFSPPGPYKTHVEITLGVKHLGLRKPFENSIIKYLETSQPAIKKKEELAEFYQIMIAELDQELLALQELKKQILTQTKLGDDVVELYTRSVELKEKKIRFEQEAKSIEIFQIVKGFDGMNKPKKASPMQFSLLGAGAGFALLVFLSFLKFFAEYYRNYHQKQST